MAKRTKAKGAARKKPGGARRSAATKSAARAGMKRASPGGKAKRAKRAKAIPDGYLGATPYICCKGAADAIDFYVKAFGAKETMRMPMPDGRVGHAEIKIGKAPIMLSDEFPDHDALSPETVGGSPVTLHVYVKDVDAFVEKAVNAGATVMSEVMDQFYGDRSGKIKDPFGHVWSIATHIEDVTPREMKKRAAKMFSAQ